ncbi:hypothetical protein V8J88_05120 [Massilia sp. W12]|uniref:hypothetical protein n=1 Tax=Massilia sp. W12 TaxID=3126507 RepID=UPI0030CFFCBA
MLKYEFSLQTKNGQHIDNIVIAGQSQEDAQRKLFQMYHHCTILRCETRVTPQRLSVGSVHSSVEEIVDLIARER